MAQSGESGFHDKHDSDPSRSGVTTDGMAWTWQGGPIPESRLLLLAATEGQLSTHLWRVKESQRIWELFQLLQLPLVTVEWNEPRLNEASAAILPIEGHLPMWDLISERHVGVYGITQKVLESLLFDPLPPELLANQWAEIRED